LEIIAQIEDDEEEKRWNSGIDKSSFAAKG
jgi:hypothetical protein